MQRTDGSLIDLTREVKGHLGLHIITEQDRLDAIEAGFAYAATCWPAELETLRVWCYPQVPGSEHLYGRKGEWLGLNRG